MARDERHLYEQKIALVLLDVAAFFAALELAIWLRYSFSFFDFEKGGPAPWREILIAFPFVALVWVMLNGMLGAYRVRQSALSEISALVRGTLLTFVLVLAATFFYRGFNYSRGMTGFLIPLVIGCAVVGRALFRVLRRRALVRFGGRTRVAVVGQSPLGEALLGGFAADREEFDVVGTGLGAEPDTLAKYCDEQRIDQVIVVERGLSEAQVLDIIEVCLVRQVTFSMVPAVHELLLDHAHVDLVGGVPLVGMSRTNIVGFNWMVKRAFDIVVTSLLLVFAAPLMLAVALAIKLSSPGPIFYVQKRVGYRGKVFDFIKFRSMHVGNNDAIHREYTKKWITENAAHSEEPAKGRAEAASGAGGAPAEAVKIHKIVDDPRIFEVGKFIRKYSVDELPQLLNVLRGEMSLIGPRPALPYEVEVYRQWHRRRFEAPPGITGLWQVSGRNRLSFEEMVELDIDYLENWSFLLDIKILWRTVRVVLVDHAY